MNTPDVSLGSSVEYSATLSGGSTRTETGNVVGVKRTGAALTKVRGDRVVLSVALPSTYTPLKGRNVVTDVGGQMCSEPYGPERTHESNTKENTDHD